MTLPTIGNCTRHKNNCGDSHWNEHEHSIQCPKCNRQFSSSETLPTEQKNALSILDKRKCKKCMGN